jgi:hypothetical protein
MAHTQTAIGRVVAGFESRIGLSIKFDERFYNRTGINQKRWGMLKAGKLKANSDEIKTLAQVFDVPVTDLL